MRVVVADGAAVEEAAGLDGAGVRVGSATGFVTAGLAEGRAEAFTTGLEVTTTAKLTGAGLAGVWDSAKPSKTTSPMAHRTLKPNNQRALET